MYKRTILTIEDEAVVSEALKEALEGSGFKVIVTASGEDGLEKAHKHHPSIIVLDLFLPKMDGFAILKKLRRTKWGRGVFVFILTNKKIDPPMLFEIDKIPYMTSYNMKSENNVANVVRLLKERIIWEDCKRSHAL